LWKIHRHGDDQSHYPDKRDGSLAGIEEEPSDLVPERRFQVLGIDIFLIRISGIVAAVTACNTTLSVVGTQEWFFVYFIREDEIVRYLPLRRCFRTIS